MHTLIKKNIQKCHIILKLFGNEYALMLYSRVTFCKEITSMWSSMREKNWLYIEVTIQVFRNYFPEEHRSHLFHETSHVSRTLDHVRHKNLIHCRFTLRVWNHILPWSGMHHINTAIWTARVSMRDWWAGNIHILYGSTKALASLMMLTSWEI